MTTPRAPTTPLAPADDGAARHLLGMEVPAITLFDHEGRAQPLRALSGRLVMFIYPATGVPGRDPAVDPAPGWDDIPGAAGCTSQCVGYRDELSSIRAFGFEVVGVSGQAREEQAELAARREIPYALLSDPGFVLAGELRLPTFVAGGRRFYTRLTMVAVEGRVAHIVYPVFPPGGDARAVVGWLRRRFE